MRNRPYLKYLKQVISGIWHPGQDSRFNMLNTFKDWYDKNRSELKSLFDDIEIKSSPTVRTSMDKASSWIEFSNNIILGNLTVWDTGECDLVIISPNSGEQLLFEYRESSNTKELENNLDSLVEKTKRLAL